jgi:hypothetical protein
MSTTALIDSPVSGSECQAAEHGLDWLLAMLKQSMEQVMASDAKPLQKASAIARLGNLFLKTYGAAGLARENKALKRRVAAMEEELQRVREAAAAASAPLVRPAGRAAGGTRAPEPVPVSAPAPLDAGRAPAPPAPKAHAALPSNRVPGKRSSAGGRVPKSGRRAGPRRP